MKFEQELIDFSLPQELIASQPMAERDASRLLVVGDKWVDESFKNILNYVQAGDVLVFNETRVRKSRSYWQHKSKIEELILLDCISSNSEASSWRAIVSGKKLREGMKLSLAAPFVCYFRKREDQMAHVSFDAPQDIVEQWFEAQAQMPLPPYIIKARKRRSEELYLPSDEQRYQTVYAKSGASVAAPTAGLHFTPELIERIKSKGVQCVSINLEVSWGTFAPLKEANFLSNTLHSERVQIGAEASSHLKEAHQNGQRIIAVGSTSLRALEFWMQKQMPKLLNESCDVFFKPPWRPKLVQSLITNFHLPKSSLMLLVQSFSGKSKAELLDIYQHAIQQKYRFFSYGDAMMISSARPVEGSEQ